MATKKQTSTEEPRRRSFEGLERLTMEIKRITNPILGQRGFAGTDVLEYWNDIVCFSCVIYFVFFNLPKFCNILIRKAHLFSLS